MRGQTKDLLWYVALLVLTLSVAVLVPSWWQFLVYLSVTVLCWQLSFVALYWVQGRLGDTLWLMYEEGTWGYEILKNCMMPVLLVSVGAIMGRLRSIRRLR
jgi:hypothetical protein